MLLSVENFVEKQNFYEGSIVLKFGSLVISKSSNRWNLKILFDEKLGKIFELGENKYDCWICV